MKYTLNLDENNYILSIGNTPFDEVELNLEDMELDFMNAYQLVDGKVKLDKKKKKAIEAERLSVENRQKIDELKKFLSDTDYIWNSINEGRRTKEYYADVIEERIKAWKEIQKLGGK